MKPYSKDLRLRVLAAVDRGMPRKEVSRTFGVSEPSVRRFLRLRRERPGASILSRRAAPRLARAGRWRRRCPGRSCATPISRLKSTASSSRMSTAWRSPPPASAAPSLAWGCRSKKVPPGLRARRGRKRALWRRGAREIAPERLVFVDECGTHNSMSRLRARAPKCERVYGRVPRNRGRNTTLLASMTSEGMGPCMAVVGSTTKAVFETYVERVLAPSLSPGSVVVLDNLGAHRGDRVHELVEARRCELLFLPPYSPDFSPIEEAFSKLKALLRKARARARGALLEAIGSALSAITARDARGYFGHCGYPLDAQP